MSSETTDERCACCGASYQFPRRKPGVVRAVDFIPAGRLWRLAMALHEENKSLRLALGMNPEPSDV